MIVLLSDHGYLLGERGYTGKVPSQLHPELAQVPFVVVASGRRAAGRGERTTSPRPTTWAQRCSRWSASTGPSWVGGTDLSPLLDGERPAETRDFHYGGMYNRFFIRTDDWVLIGDNQGNERTLCDLRRTHRSSSTW